MTESFTAAAIDFIKQADASEEPFYINVWPDDVHSPFFPPSARRGDGKKRTLHLGVLETMDEQLGAMFDLIRDKESLRNNTLVLVCSDNGPELGAGQAGPFRGYKTWLYEGGIRSSLIIWGPGLVDSKKVGTVNDQSYFSAIDLVPSLLDVCSVETESSNFDGQSLAGTLLGKSLASRTSPLNFRRPPDRDSFYGDEDLPDLAVRDGDWKLLCEYDGSDPELYDLKSDRKETTNVAVEHPKIVERLIGELVAWHRSLPADTGDPHLARPTN